MWTDYPGEQLRHTSGRPLVWCDSRGNDPPPSVRVDWDSASRVTGKDRRERRCCFNTRKKLCKIRM